MQRVDIKWPANTAEACELQQQHKHFVRIAPLKEKPEYVGGVDAAFSDDWIFAAACVYRYPDLVLLEQSTAVLKATFPYIPGYLFFREGPAIVSALRKLAIAPDVILVDGQGIAHPRGIGSASHLGILLGVATIGCAKTALVGESRQPGTGRKSASPLIFEGRIVGAVLRTKKGVKPLFISPGHNINVSDSINVVLGCIGQYRTPEPLRCADILSRKAKAGN